MAIHRMPDAASSTARPSFTNANAKTSTHDAAKNSVVVRISQLLASIAKSFRSTSQAVLRNVILCSRAANASCGADERAVARPETRRGRFIGQQTAVANQRHARHEPVGQIEVVRGEHHNR